MATPQTVPAAGASRPEPRPAGFVDMDHRRRQRPPAQRLVAGLQMPRQGLDLIPQRLRLDDQALARHHPDLALEREMIGVLRDGHAHGKRRRIPAAGDQRGRRGRGDHGAVARAPVLLPGVVLDVIRRLHRGDALGRLALPDELGERPATGRTPALIRRQLVPHLDDRQGRLLARPVARPRRAAAWPGACGRAVEDGRPRLLQRLLDGERELGDLGQSAQPRELRGQLEILGDEALILALEEETDLPERLDVAFFSERHHVAAQ